MYHRQSETCGFTGAGLGDTQQVFVRQYFRNSGLLNVAGFCEAKFRDRIAIGVVQPKSRKRVVRHNMS